MYEQPFYLTAVSHGREFERVLKDRKTFKVHSVFTHAVNLVAGSGFLTILPLGRGCGKDVATVAVSERFSFFALDVSPGDEAGMPASCSLCRQMVSGFNRPHDSRVNRWLSTSHYFFLPSCSFAHHSTNSQRRDALALSLSAQYTFSDVMGNVLTLMPAA